MALLSKNFDSETTGAVPSGWTEVAGSGYWTTQTAPAGMSGKALRGAQWVGSDSYFSTPTFTKQTSGIVYVGWWQKTGTVGSGKQFAYVTLRDNTTFRCGTYIDNTTMYGYYGSGGASTVAIKTSVASDTVYYVCAALDIDNKLVKYAVNGTWTDNSGSWYSVGATRPDVDRLYFDSYTGTSHGTYNWIDNLLVSTSAPLSTAPTPSTGTLYASGTHQSIACGGSIYGQVTLVYEGTGSTTATAWKVERSSDNSTWADISSSCTITDLGSGNAKIVDLRPQYGSQSIAYGGTGYYRVSPKATQPTEEFVLDGSSVGYGSATSAVSLTIDVTKASVRSASYAITSTYMAGHSGYVPSAAGSSNVYPGEALLTMALAYRETGTAQYLTDADAQYTYIGTLLDANNILHFPDYSSSTYRDHHCRTATHLALASRILNYAGATTLSNSCLSRANTMAKAWLDQVNAGSPTASKTKTGHYPAGQTAWASSTSYSAGAIVRKTTTNGRTYRAMNAGTSGGSEPTWPTSTGGTVSDNGITWKETSYTGQCSYPTYGATSTYTAVGSTTVDPNQNATEAALFALLYTDTRSDFYAAGTYRTKALTAITDAVGLICACQASDGAVTLGDAFDESSSLAKDTLYGGFTLAQLALVKHLMGNLLDELPLFLSRGLNWLETRSGGASEPYTAVRYTGDTVPGFSELYARAVAARVLSTTSLVDKAVYSAAFFDTTSPGTGEYGAYSVTGSVTTFGSGFQSIWDLEAYYGAVLGVVEKTYTADGVVAARNTQTYTADGYVFAAATKTYTADGVVQVTNTKTYTADGVVVAGTAATVVNTYTADGVVTAPAVTTTSAYTADGVVVTASPYPNPPDPSAPTERRHRATARRRRGGEW